MTQYNANAVMAAILYTCAMWARDHHEEKLAVYLALKLRELT